MSSCVQTEGPHTSGRYKEHPLYPLSSHPPTPLCSGSEADRPPRTRIKDNRDATTGVHNGVVSTSRMLQ